MRKGNRRIVRLDYDVRGRRWIAVLACGHDYPANWNTKEGRYVFCPYCRMQTWPDRDVAAVGRPQQLVDRNRLPRQ